MLQKTKTSKILIATAILASISIPLAVRLTADDAAGDGTANGYKTRALPIKAFEIALEEGYFAKRSFTGRALAGRVSPLAFEVGGTLTDIRVDLGSRVQKGETLAQLDTSLMSARRSELVAEREEAIANLDLANRTLQRTQETFKQGHTSAQRRDEAEANAISLKARVARLSAAIKSMDVDIERATIKAPFAGTITQRLMDEGTITSPGQAVIELSEDARLEAQIGMPAGYADAIQKGANYSLHDTKRATIDGAAIRAVVPVINGSTRTMMVSFDLPATKASRGELITAVVDDWNATQGAWVPLRALTADVRGLWRLYKIVEGENGPEIKFENVQVHYSTADSAFVSGTISDGDSIIADGVSKLAPGQRVSVLDSETLSGR